MAVNTTFLPKTNGLVFLPRLKARSDKGRVFGSVDGTDNPIPPAEDSASIAATVPGINGSPLVGETLTAIPPDVAGPVGFVYSGWNYTWGYYQTGEAIGTGETYVVQPEDAGKQIVVVAAIAAARTVVLPSPPTPPVTWKPASVTIIKGPESSYTVAANQLFRITCTFENNYHIASNGFRYRAPNGQWKALNNKKLEQDYPGTRMDIQQTTSQQDKFHTLQLIWFTKDGGVPTEFKYFCRDTNDYVDPPDTDTEQIYFTIVFN